MNPNNIPGTQTDDAHVTSAVVDGTVLVETPKGEISLAELNQMLGKSFPTKEAALKSIVDTQSFVGKRKEDIVKEYIAQTTDTDATNKLSKQIEDMRKDNFYRDNPQYATPEVRALIDKLGNSPAEVVNQADFKAFFEKAKGFDEIQKSRNVLDSNPRLASSKDAMAKIVELKNSGAHQDTVETQLADLALSTISPRS